MLIELDKVLAIAVNSGSNEINCGLLSAVLKQIIKKLDLVEHPIEVNEQEFDVVQHVVASSIELTESDIPKVPASSDERKQEFADLRRLSEEIVCVRNSEHSLSAFFDVVNIVKRIDALEIGIRLLGGALQDIRADDSEDEQVNLNAAEAKNQQQHQCELDTTLLSSLNTKIDWLSDELRKLDCKCNRHDNVVAKLEKFEQHDDDEEQNVTIAKVEHNKDEVESGNIPSNVDNSSLLSSLQSDVNDIRHTLKAAEDGSNQFMKSVTKQLETFRRDLINCLSETQSMMDCKVDKCHFVQDLATFVDEKITEATERIFQRAAAGTTRALISDVNCVSCGDNAVVQIDATAAHFPPTQRRQQPFSVGEIENRQQQHSVKHPTTRHCGGGKY